MGHGDGQSPRQHQGNLPNPQEEGTEAGHRTMDFVTSRITVKNKFDVTKVKAKTLWMM